jgi:hypothetical protein
MSEAVRITTEVPSVEETARVAGVPLSRAKKLVELARMSRVESRSSPRRPAFLNIPYDDAFQNFYPPPWY